VQDRNDVAAAENLSTSNGLVTPRDGQSVLPQGLVFKALEIEELADVYFFRPLGFIVARCAAALGVTPIQLTILSVLVGVTGGALLYGERLGLLGFALLIIYSVFDSADGQLARLTGRVTELGRVLDGVGGYVTHAAIYLAIAAGLLQRGGSGAIIIWTALAALANMAQAQMYEYHRHHYAMIVVKRLVPRDDPAKIASPWIKWLYRWYLAVQQMLNGLHVEVESVIAARSTVGAVREDDRATYRECFYWPARGWNLLGDNTRFYAIGVLVCLHRIDLFFAFILVPMNLAFVALWLWQRRADRRFLASL
jgi:phosphatidylglycerophosphate synthase